MNIHEPTEQEPWAPDDLGSIEARVWDRLEEAADAAGAPWRWPVVATCGGGGRGVEARVMVLRAASRARSELTCYTDARSPKLAALRADPSMAWTFHDPVARVQLRVAARATIHAGDALAESLWHTVPERGRRDYATRLPPGAGIGAPVEGHDFRGALAAHFAVVVARVSEIDWLWLAPGGHRRAVFRYAPDGALASAGWLVP